MTQPQTQAAQTTQKAQKPAKADLMKAFEDQYEQIQIAKDALETLENQASEAAAAVVKNYGKGPHKMGQDKIVTFQNVAHKTRHNVLDLKDAS